MGWVRRLLPKRSPPTDSAPDRSMSDLKVKDQEIDGLLQTANALVFEMRMQVDRASGALRKAVEEGGHDRG